jgi:hypothetical protein
MSKQSIDIKTVYELLRENDSEQPTRYFIPSYQRGYRWTSHEVSQLLDDVLEFTNRKDPNPEEFYCLQPLVVRKNSDGSYDVIDGQQRLTTLLLILRHFNERQVERFRQKLFTLEYQTRADLLPFLEDPTPERASGNIDYFHISKAIETIEQWFLPRENEVDRLKDAFLNRVKLIWFQLSASEKPVAAFTRLNVGKIPLTDGELIRALFLRRAESCGTKELQLRIAYEWDLIEKALQRPDFWAFLTNDLAVKENRIGFLFRLAMGKMGTRIAGRTYGTFYEYSRTLNAEGADPEREWDKIKQLYMLLEEWHEDRTLFHMIGFLICSGASLADLVEISTGQAKREFRRTVLEKISASILRPLAPTEETSIRQRVIECLGELDYGAPSARPKIRSVLLLFNLLTLHQKQDSNLRFQFDSFKSESWDLEHVRSVIQDYPDTLKGQRAWLEPYLSYLSARGRSKRLAEEITGFLQNPPAKEKAGEVFALLFDKILKHFKEDGDDRSTNLIGNLALLDCGTNRGYGNAAFAVKRHKILLRDKAGVFIPPSTRNVFLKCYSPMANHLLFWTSADREGYILAIAEALKDFFEGEWIDE